MNQALQFLLIIAVILFIAGLGFVISYWLSDASMENTFNSPFQAEDFCGRNNAIQVGMGTWACKNGCNK